MKAVVMTRQGGPEVMEFAERPEPVPGPGQALIEIAAAGVNFMDIGVRHGTAWTEMPNPKILGVEGAGRVVSVGHGVENVRPGERVAWVYAPGSYSERAAIPADALVPIPDEIDDRMAAAVMMQGLTASHFATDFYPVQAGDIALVHAAAGGLGLLLTQVIKLRGGHVIGRVSSAGKVAIAQEAGADHVIVDTEGQFAKEAVRFSDGEGVHVVYDGSGPKTFQGSLDALRISGTFCWYGPVLGGPGPDRHHEAPEEHQNRLRHLFRSYPYTSTAPLAGGSTFRLDHRWQAQDQNRWRISAGGSGERPCRHGKPNDHGQAPAHTVETRTGIPAKRLRRLPKRRPGRRGETS